MIDKILLRTLLTTAFATISFVLVNILMRNKINFLTTMSFIVVFGVVFDIGSRLRLRK